jgi:Family of unknown function (DUF6494)
MDENQLNISIRKYLKEFGVTAQRAVETAVREALQAGRLQGNESLKVKGTLELASLGLRHEVDGQITLE